MKNSKPNIVLITIDALRADFVGYQNSKEKNSPFLDRLSKKSYTYRNAITPGMPTHHCFPSLMTGTSPFKYGNYFGIPRNKEVRTIAEVLKENGYLTAAFIADNPFLYQAYGYNRGFDFYFDRLEKTASHISLEKRLEEFFKKTLSSRTFEVFRSVYRPLRAPYWVFLNPPRISVPGETLNQKVKKFMRRKAKAPFFLWLHYMDIHGPYFSGLKSIKNLMTKIVFYQKIYHCVEKKVINDPQLLMIIKEAYRRAIQYTDKQIKDIYDFFHQIYPNSIFIITSDHGEAFMEHGKSFHYPYSLYNELIKVPLLINFPSGENEKINKIVSLLSLPKTICSILGLKKNFFQGDDLSRENKDYSEINRITGALYGDYFGKLIKQGVFDNITKIKGNDKLWSYTTQEYKYIVRTKGFREEFYDLKKDPLEKNNIAGDNKIYSKKRECLKFLRKYASTGINLL